MMGPGSLIAVERTARDAGNLLPVDDRRAVQDHRDPPPDQLDVEGLPFAGRAGRLDGRRDKAIDAAHAQRVERLAGVVLNLHLVAAAKYTPLLLPGGNFSSACSRNRRTPRRDEIDAGRNRMKRPA